MIVGSAVEMDDWHSALSDDGMDKNESTHDLERDDGLADAEREEHEPEAVTAVLARVGVFMSTPTCAHAALASRASERFRLAVCRASRSVHWPRSAECGARGSLARRS
jgi:hypothetical protein